MGLVPSLFEETKVNSKVKHLPLYLEDSQILSDDVRKIILTCLFRGFMDVHDCDCQRKGTEK